MAFKSVFFDREFTSGEKSALSKEQQRARELSDAASESPAPSGRSSAASGPISFEDRFFQNLAAARRASGTG